MSNKNYNILLNDRRDSGDIFVDVIAGDYKDFSFRFSEIVSLKDENDKYCLSFKYDLLQYPETFTDTDVAKYQSFVNKLFDEVTADVNRNNDS